MLFRSEIAKALGIEKEDTDSLIVFKESLFEKTVKENIKLKKYIDKLKEVKQQLKIEYEKLTESVKRYENMRRNCKDEFYLKSYQTTIHKLNAKRETISNIIDLLEK